MRDQQKDTGARDVGVQTKMNSKYKEVLEVNDYQDMLKRGSTYLKVRKWVGGKLYYEEIDLEEYDKRIAELAKKIASAPEVDLLSLLKDALYDLNLDRLDRVEQMVNTELEKSKKEKRPSNIKTTPRQRGTCVNLAVGGKFAVMLRA